MSRVIFLLYIFHEDAVSLHLPIIQGSVEVPESPMPGCSLLLNVIGVFLSSHGLPLQEFLSAIPSPITAFLNLAFLFFFPQKPANIAFYSTSRRLLPLHPYCVNHVFSQRKG